MDQHEDEAALPLGAAGRRSLEAIVDRIEDRLRDAPEGLHRVGPPATPEAIAAAGLPEATGILWEHWDGLDLANAEALIFSLDEVARASAAARESGQIAAGDRVIGERGRDLLVLVADPYAEGADVALVEEDGERLPFASSALRMVLALLGEIAILYDEEGEYHDDLFGDDGELAPAIERRLLRRHLDLDPDAPLARFRLAQSLRRAGEARAALAELKVLLRRAPDFAWAHHERGRVALLLGDAKGAPRAFARAAELAADPDLRAYFRAWEALASEGDARKRAAAAVLEAMPSFAAAQEAGVRAALEDGEASRAGEQLRLGLAVMPGHLGLLSLRAEVEAALAAAEAKAEASEPEAKPTPRSAPAPRSSQPAAPSRSRGSGSQQSAGGSRPRRGRPPKR